MSRSNKTIVAKLEVISVAIKNIKIPESNECGSFLHLLDVCTEKYFLPHCQLLKTRLYDFVFDPYPAATIQNAPSGVRGGGLGGGDRVASNQL